MLLRRLAVAGAASCCCALAVAAASADSDPRSPARTPPGAAAAAAAASPNARVGQQTQPQQQQPAADADAEGVTYRVYDGRTGAPRTLSDVVRAALAPVPPSHRGTVLLIGEAHDDSAAHAFERRLLREVWAGACAGGGAAPAPAAPAAAAAAAPAAAPAAMAEAPKQHQHQHQHQRPLVLCLEMFERDVQGVLDEVINDDRHDGPTTATGLRTGGDGGVGNDGNDDDLGDDGLQPILLIQKQEQQQQQHPQRAASLAPPSRPCLFREEDLLRDARPWPNYYQDYRPLVDDARAAGARVVAANAPRRYVSVAGRHGAGALEAAVPPGSPARQWLAPLPHARASESYARRIDGAMRAAAEALRGAAGAAGAGSGGGGGDGGGGGGGSSSSDRGGGLGGDDKTGGGGCPYTGFSVSSNFLAAQSLWDATMAWTVAEELVRGWGAGGAGGGGGAGAAAAAAAAAASTAPPPPQPLVALVAGRFHIEHGLGVPEHLRAYCGAGGGGAGVASPSPSPSPSPPPASAAAAVGATPDPPPLQPLMVSVVIVQATGVSMSAEQLRRDGALGIADFLVLSDGKLPPSFRTVHL